MSNADVLNHTEPRGEQPAAERDGNDAGFWQHLADAFEKRPTAVDSMPASVPRIDPATLYRVLRRCGEHLSDCQVRYYHHRSDDSVWHLYSDVPADVLPTSEDQSLAGYAARMRRQVASPDGYSILVNGPFVHDEVIWRTVRDFGRELVRRIGLPSRGFDANFGLGQYDFTSSGVHYDGGRAAYILPVVGKKRFRVWPEDYVRAHPKLKHVRGRYGAMKDDSTVVEAGPGGVLYWPGNAWHIYEGDGDFTAMMTLGAWVGPELANLPCDVDRLQDSAQQIPDGFSVRSIADSPNRMQNAPIEQVWVGFLSGLGLRSPIPLRRDVLPEGPLRGQRHPLIWRPLPDGQFALGVNGHCLVLSGNWLTALIEQINSSVPFTAADFASHPAGAAVRALLDRLWACGALESHAPSL
ncbi:MAG: hypothetical protein SH850_08570 [Planctomycetaceae bacterium]|nr:hypothetical protein [Planctomycetaceae bacterium]